MATKYRLLARAQLHGEVREPGYIFTLEDGEKGPHRTVRSSDHGAQLVDHIAQASDLVDEPLYEEVKEQEAKPDGDKPKLIEDHSK